MHLSASVTVLSPQPAIHPPLYAVLRWVPVPCRSRPHSSSPGGLGGNQLLLREKELDLNPFTSSDPFLEGSKQWKIMKCFPILVSSTFLGNIQEFHAKVQNSPILGVDGLC